LILRGIDEHRRSWDARPLIFREYRLQYSTIFRGTGVSTEQARQVIYVFEGLVCALTEVLSIA
jgi:hypothetical protein